MALREALLDPATILDLFVMFLTVIYLVRITVAARVRQPVAVEQLQEEISFRHFRGFESAVVLKDRLLRFFEVGTHVSFPKRSLCGQ